MIQVLEQQSSPPSEDRAVPLASGVELLARGRCRVGVAKVDITPRGREPMAGFSLSGSKGTPGKCDEKDVLWARALYLEDEQTAERVLLCIVDLLSASLALVQSVQRILEQTAPHLQHALVLAGTHTHTAPGRFFGNRFYDRLAAPLAVRRFNRRLTDRMARQIAEACVAAEASASEGQLSVLRGRVWGAGRNRSLPAHLENRRDPELGAVPWGPPPAGLDPEEGAVDPRVTLLCASVDAEITGVFAWFGCHGTALGPRWKHYNRDWLGVAVDAVEEQLKAEGRAAQGLICAVGSGASGDVSPLPRRRASNGHAPQSGRRASNALDWAGFVASNGFAGSNGYGGSNGLGTAIGRAESNGWVAPDGPVVVADVDPPGQGPQLARRVGQRVAAGILTLVRHAPLASSEPLPPRLERGTFEIAPDELGPRWQIGVAALGGAEDGGPSFGRLQKLVAEGVRGDGGPHHPKAPALGVLQALTFGVLDIARSHPFYRLWLGEHVLCSVPGEPTAMAALTLEQAMQRRLRVSSVSVIGYAGDYAGYFTTPYEYRAQHYEGASTLYGPRSLEWYREQLGGASRSRSAAAHGAEGAVPLRSVQRLTSVAHQVVENPRPVELLFAITARVPGVPSERPEVCLSTPAGASIPGACRRYAPPDPVGAPELDTFIAAFEPRAVAALEVPLEALRLDVWHAGGLEGRTIVPHAEARDNGALPLPEPLPSLSWVARTLLGLGLLDLAVALALLVAPEPLQQGLGWGVSTPFQTLSMRLLALTFLLLGINQCIAKSSRDLRALSGYPLGASAFAASLAVFSEWVKSAHAAAIACAAAAIAWLLLGVRLHRGKRREQGTPSRAHWEFWSPLFWVGVLTLFVGVLLIALPGVFVDVFGIADGEAPDWVRLIGAGFLVNTIAMWRAQYTRDLKVVSAQLWGSLAFDATAPVLLAIAIANGTLRPPALLLLLPFLGIVSWFSGLTRTARARARLAIEAPRTTQELARLVRDARRERRRVRVLGSRHSVPAAIHGDAEPHPRGRRPSNDTTVHVSLERFDRLVAVDRARRRISVEAGMRIGVDPGHDDSIGHNLLRHLQVLGWALPDLGGIVHQTVGGFLATGSSGGSVHHGLHDAVVELRYVDGTGQIRVLRRDVASERDELLALLVSVGLLGIVTEVTFECEPVYAIEGREITAPVVGATARLPASEGIPARTILLDSAGADGLGAYLKETEYVRILWWPGKKLSSMVIWEARRGPYPVPAPTPYRPTSPLLQFLAGRVLDVLGWSYAPGGGGVIGKWLRDVLLPPFARQFFPKKPARFNDRWDVNLPMDTHVDEAFLPVEFTELWFDIEDTAAVMASLIELYRDNDDLAGTFAVELYVAKASDAWLSPSHGRDSFRVDLFWYQKNHGDPVLDYYPAFYDKLGKFAFRAHWGKYLPEPGSAQGSSYLTRQYPKWEEFSALRSERDPDGVFLTGYWQRHLGIACARCAASGRGRPERG